MNTPSRPAFTAVLLLASHSPSLFAGTLQLCYPEAKKARSECSALAREAPADYSLIKAKHQVGSDTIAKGSAAAQASSVETKAYAKDKQGECAKSQKRCEECNPKTLMSPEGPEKLPEEKKLAAKEYKSCKSDTQSVIDRFAADQGAAEKYEQAGKKVNEPSSSNSKPQAQNGDKPAEKPAEKQASSQMPPPPPLTPPQQQPTPEKPKKDEPQTETASATPPASTETKKEEEKPPQAGFATAATSDECKQVPKTAVCLKKEQVELAALCSDPKNSSSDQCKKPGQISTASIPAAGSVGLAPAAAGGGGGATATGGAGAQQSLVDANKLRQLADEAGTRDSKNQNKFGSLDTGGGGGFTYGAGAPPPEEDSSGSAGGGMRAQSVGGRSVSSTHDAANATDIEKRYGPSVIHILSDNLKQKCDQGRFMHCEPKR